MATIKRIIQIGGAVLSALWTAASFMLDAQGLAPSIKWQYYALGGFIAFIASMGWIVWDKQSQLNKINNAVRLMPTPKTIGTYHDETTGGTGIKLVIDLEIWADRDVHTDNLVLNIVSSRMSLLFVPWWKVWKRWHIVLRDIPFFKRIVGLRPESGQYRVSIRSADAQPFKDTVTFRLGNKETEDVLHWSRSNTFGMELVLVTGIPNNTYRQDLKWEFVKRETLTPI